MTKQATHGNKWDLHLSGKYAKYAVCLLRINDHIIQQRQNINGLRKKIKLTPCCGRNSFN